jgi:acyl-CoA synthetase (NDP forming)
LNIRAEPSPLLLHSLGKVDALLNPRNVVILGASDAPGNWSQRVWRNLHRYKFPGPVYPLNPRRETVWDTRCYRSFADLPEPPDHVVVVIPAPFVPDALIEARTAGARSATVLTAGFAESADPAARTLSARLKAVIAETGLAVSGPNCFGNLNARASLMTMPDDRMQRIVNGPVAIVGQSGGLAMAIKRALEERGIDAGSVVTSGNQAGLSTPDYIGYHAMNDDVRVIVAYLESVNDADAFMTACRAARSRGKPVVVLKLGASVEGRAAALAHTGALAGAMEAFDAVAGAAGVIRVRTVDDIVEVTEYFLHAPLPRVGVGLGQGRAADSSPPPCGEGMGVGVGVQGDAPRSSNNDPPPHPSPTRGEGVACGGAQDHFNARQWPPGPRLGAITFSGALRGLLLDAAAANGLAFASLAEPTRQRLAAVLGVGTIIGNPLDSGFTGLTSRERYVKCIEALLEDPGIDVVLLQAEVPRAPGMDRHETNMRDADAVAARSNKPVVLFSMGSYGFTDYSRDFRAKLPHLPCLQEVDKTLRALRTISDYAARTAEKIPTPPALMPPTLPSPARRGAVERGLREREGGGPTGNDAFEKLLGLHAKSPEGQPLNEVESKRLLKAYGIRAPREAVARSAAAAVAIAKRIGFPVVAKAVSAALPHKSDAGAVVMGLANAKAVRAAYRQILDCVVKHTGAEPEGVLIAEMVADGIELVIGANRDPEVGPVILFGSGGIALELYRDVAVAAPLADERDALALIARTRAGQLIEGYRGRPALDRKAAVEALVGLSRLMLDAKGRIESIDVNPFLLRRRGGVALDALVVLSGNGA